VFITVMLPCCDGE